VEVHAQLEEQQGDIWKPNLFRWRRRSWPFVVRVVTNNKININHRSQCVLTD
jgi:hypothetical protein